MKTATLCVGNIVSTTERMTARWHPRTSNPSGGSATVSGGFDSHPLRQDPILDMRDFRK